MVLATAYLIFFAWHIARILILLLSLYASFQETFFRLSQVQIPNKWLLRSSFDVVLTYDEQLSCCFCLG